MLGLEKPSAELTAERHRAQARWRLDPAVIQNLVTLKYMKLGLTAFLKQLQAMRSNKASKESMLHFFYLQTANEVDVLRTWLLMDAGCAEVVARLLPTRRHCFAHDAYNDFGSRRGID